MLNKVIFIGRLSRDPETKYISRGQAVWNFSIATDESYKDRSGERQNRTEWHKVTARGKLPDIARKYLHKGSLFYVKGKIQSRAWKHELKRRVETKFIDCKCGWFQFGLAVRAKRETRCGFSEEAEKR